MALSPELEAIRDAMNKETGDGRDRDLAVELSTAYVEAHPELTAEMHDWDISRVVESVSVFRAAGFEEKQWQLEAYLLAKFEPQSIGGVYQPELRMPLL